MTSPYGPIEGLAEQGITERGSKLREKYIVIHSSGEIEMRDGRNGVPNGPIADTVNATAVIRVRTALESISLDVIKCRDEVKFNGIR